MPNTALDLSSSSHPHAVELYGFHGNHRDHGCKRDFRCSFRFANKENIQMEVS